MQRTTTSQPAAAEKEGFRPDIEGLRGIAVAIVVLYHAGLLSNAGMQIPGGFIGVDLFFVVSGFLITGLLIRERERNGRISFSRFYARRVRRILPAAAVVLLITIPIADQLVTLLARPAVMQDAASAALSVANIRFAETTDYFNPERYSPFLHFWSLGVEEQFYFVWPAIMAVAAWRKPRIGAAVALTAIIVGSFAVSVLMTADSPAWAFYMLPTRAWQLAAGGLLAIGAGSLDKVPRLVGDLLGKFMGMVGWVALAWLGWATLDLLDPTASTGAGVLIVALAIGGVTLALVTPRSTSMSLLGWAAMAELIAAAFAIDSKTVPYPGMAALAPTVAGVILIATGPERLGAGMLLRLPPVRFIGKISYSLYLWHWPLLILGGLYLGGREMVLTPGQALVLAAFAVPVATVSWALIEEPFRRGRIPLPRPSRVVAAGVAVMLMVAMLGASFDMRAQTVLASLGGPDIADADPTPTPSPSSTFTFVPPGTPEPGQTPTPTPALTPALAPTPEAGQPSSYAITNSTRPRLAKAETDYEAVWRENCLGWYPTTVPRNCVYGNPNGEYTVALVGDSHASALFPAVQAVADAHGWKLLPYLKISCSFLDMRIHNVNLKREYTECKTWNDNVVARLNANPPDLILVNQSRWMFPEVDAEANVTAEGEAMAREIEKLPKTSRIVIVNDVPLPSIKIPECLSDHLDDYRQCAYSRAVGLGYFMGRREQLASNITGVPIVSLTQDICPGTGACPAVLRNMIIWRDEHHLTATFAKTLGPALDYKLVRVLVAVPGPSPSPQPAP
jgi:peptidoglycan/LPS O-acetylase OafA/YrhL